MKGLEGRCVYGERHCRGVLFLFTRKQDAHILDRGD